MNTNSENSLFNTKVIYDITKFSHLDYPDHLASIVWFSGCNMRCDFCYNKDIVYAKNGHYTYNDALKFLESRVGLLDAVVLSGGEATSHNLVEFSKEIKKLGFLIKLDTNGTNYNSLSTLIENNLLDYIALDYKAPSKKFTQITQSNQYKQFSNSLDLLIKSKIEFEVRTTLHNDLLDVDDINYIIKDIVQRGYTNKYYVQRFLDTGDNIANLEKSTTFFDESKLISDLEIVWR